jgi:formimidoylglutamate deiminase
VAIHSLRAATPQSIANLVHGCEGDAGPIHLHIAEQMAEVEACLAATGLRPIEWLAREFRLDARWHLVHATHATPGEIEKVGEQGAGVVICPSTEANLGDGLTDLPHWLRQSAPLSIGSDSHVSRNWPAELALLEYGQRLALQARNVAALPGESLGSTAARLFNRSLAGGAAAARRLLGALKAGVRADLLVLDGNANGILGVPLSHALDTLVFACDAPAFAQVWVGGERVVEGGQPIGAAAHREAFECEMQKLWADR